MAWQHEHSAWIAPGQRLQVPVPLSKKGSRLAVDFEVIQGLDVDFDIMLEGEHEKVVRLYGPTRRARSVNAILEIPFDGDVYVTFDNINSWFVHKLVSYSLVFTKDADAEVQSSSRMRFGKALVMTPKGAQDEEVPDLDGTDPTIELRIPAGCLEEISLNVIKGQRLNISFEVIEGRDVDFGIMLLEEGMEAPISLYGPSRRATMLRTSMPVPATGTIRLGFDTSYTWFSSKLVRYAVSARADELC